MAPKGTSPDLIARLNAAFRQTLAAPDVLARFKTLQIDVAVSTPEELRKTQIEEIATRTPLLAELGLIQE